MLPTNWFIAEFYANPTVKSLWQTGCSVLKGRALTLKINSSQRVISWYLFQRRDTYSEAKKDIMASNPRNLTISGVFLAVARFFATIGFADTEFRKNDIISKKRLPAGCWTAFACGESAVPVFKGRKCDLSRSESFLRTFCPFFVFLFVKYLCLPERRLVIGYIYKKEDCDCSYDRSDSEWQMQSDSRGFVNPHSCLAPVLTTPKSNDIIFWKDLSKSILMHYKGVIMIATTKEGEKFGREQNHSVHWADISVLLQAVIQSLRRGGSCGRDCLSHSWRNGQISNWISWCLGLACRA